ncbi:MAG: hypothetical protein ABIA04_02900 [Pseudomonadota bacterium]
MGKQDDIFEIEKYFLKDIPDKTEDNYVSEYLMSIDGSFDDLTIDFDADLATHNYSIDPNFTKTLLNHVADNYESQAKACDKAIDKIDHIIDFRIDYTSIPEYPDFEQAFSNQCVRLLDKRIREGMIRMPADLNAFKEWAHDKEWAAENLRASAERIDELINTDQFNVRFEDFFLKDKLFLFPEILALLNKEHTNMFKVQQLTRMLYDLDNYKSNRLNEISEAKDAYAQADAQKSRYFAAQTDEEKKIVEYDIFDEIRSQFGFRDSELDKIKNLDWMLTRIEIQGWREDIFLNPENDLVTSWDFTHDPLANFYSFVDSLGEGIADITYVFTSNTMENVLVNIHDLPTHPRF